MANWRAMTEPSPAAGRTDLRRPLHGSCLCNEVRFEVEPPVRDVFACHCHRCQKTSGNFVAATAAPASAISFDAESTLRWYHPVDDPGVAYGFCERCGSSLFFRVVDDPGESVSIMAGSLDGSTGLRTTEVWFTANAADHVTLDPGVVHYPTQPPPG